MLSISVQAYTYYDIPLSDELQEYTQDLCEEYEVNYPVIIAIMGEESRYQADTISETKDYGIMQININNHAWISDSLGTTDIMDVKQNIHAGVYILSKNKDRCDDTAYLINAYNMGHARAYRLHRDGIRQGVYLDKVVERMENLKIKEGY